MHLLRLTRVLPVLIAVAALGAGPLGASAARTDDATFAKTGAPFTFSYPSSFQIASYHGGTKLNTPTYQVALGIDTHDYLLVQTYALKITVDKSGAGVGPDGSALSTTRVDALVDAAVGALTNRAGFTDQAPPVSGKLGALRARVYRVMTSKHTLASTIYVAISGRTEYYLACQATPKGAASVVAACNRVLKTFAKR